MRKENNMFLEKLKENNQYPIIFIGSGITQRYFENAPTWEGLIQEFWDRFNGQDAYFSIYHTLKEEGKTNFEILTLLADKLEKQIDSLFYSQQLTIPNLSLAEAHSHHLSPFRQLLAYKFPTLQIRNGVKDELASFTKMLVKARQIITTNYDPLIENCLNGHIKINVGNGGLFDYSSDWGELYKIHGSVSNPESIRITSGDYQSMEKTATLVNAKILTNLTESPILFFGYSLTDKNILSLLKDYAENLPFDIAEASRRIGVVEWSKGKIDISDTLSQISDLNIHYTKIETDNFKEIYETISEINQGYTPHEIAKYQSAFKQIIEIKGKSKELKQVLTSFVDIDHLPEELKNKDLVVAFGDSRYLYKMPDYRDYIQSYFGENDDLPVEIAFKFVSQFANNVALPIRRFVKKAIDLSEDGNLALPPKIVTKINNFMKNTPDLQTLTDKISDSTLGIKNIHLIKSKPHATPQDVFDITEIKERVKILYITKYIELFSREDVGNFAHKLLQEYSATTLSKTEFRKFFFAYSFILDPESVQLPD